MKCRMPFHHVLRLNVNLTSHKLSSATRLEDRYAHNYIWHGLVARITGSQTRSALNKYIGFSRSSFLNISLHRYSGIANENGESFSVKSGRGYG